MKFLKASAAKNKSLKFNIPKTINNSEELILAIRSSCVQGRCNLTIKNKNPKTLSILVKLLKKNGYKVKKKLSTVLVSW